MVYFRLLSKKRMVVIGSGALAGILFFSKVLPRGQSCVTSCLTNKPYSSYGHLQSNEESLHFAHPRISSVYINYLPSNSPNEDRFVAGWLKRDCAGLFGVIDGHKSPHCSEHLKNVLLKHVTSVLNEEKLIVSGEVEEYVNDSVLTGKPPTTDIPLTPPTGDEQQCNLKEGIEDALRKSFVSLDDKISEEALKCVRLIGKGRSIKEEGMLERIVRVFAGACALLSLVSANDIYIASTGDCRAVLGAKKQLSKEWLTIPLSVDQNSQNELEVARLNREHPAEKDTVIINNRLLGGLMPFRSFGDVDYKWSTKDLEIVSGILPNYKTPPYLTAEPVVTRHVMNGDEKFLIIATDGLWDKLSNEDAVKIVSTSLYGETKFGLASFFQPKSSSQTCCKDGDNPATNLLWEALGGEEKKVQDMLNAPKEYRRWYRDDITVIVIKFK